MSELPKLTNSWDQAKVDIANFGIALLADQLSEEQLRLARAATYAAAEDDVDLGRKAERFGLDYGVGNIRVWNILNRAPVFREIVQFPVVLELVQEVIGWPALLGNISANIAQPASEGGRWHQDQLFVPKPWPAEPQGLNMGWLLDDFTVHNGATEVLLGSHLLEEMDADRLTETLASEAVPVVAPAGTLLAMDSRVFHRTGCNRTKHPRAALFGWYTRPIYRTQENWFLSLDQSVVDEATDELLILLGYKTQGLGLVYGKSPR
ncbi:MAG: phytanoyl-CoA dioxygenase family protein [Pseudomonadota bacterium]